MLTINIGCPLLTRLEHLGIPLMRRLLIFNKKVVICFNKLLSKICVIQKQVPLPLPCVNFAQITTLSLTDLQIKLLVTKYFNKGSALAVAKARTKL